MELTYKYINEFKQFGSIDFDLIIFDTKNEDEILFRISKSFNEDITEEEMNAIAQDAVDVYLTSLEVTE